MSLLCYNNLVPEASYITVTVASGTKIDITSPDLLLNRSIDDKYRFNLSATTTVTITIGVSGGLRCAGLLSCNNIGSLSADVSHDHRLVKIRSILPTNVRDQILVYDNLVAHSDIEFSFTGFVGDCEIGAAWFSNGVDVDVKPTQRYNAEDTGEKTRTQGGQIITSEGELYETYECTLAPLKTSECRSTGTTNIYEFNRFCKTTEPLIFIPEMGDNVHIYGTQKKPVSYRQVQDGKNGGEWLWECGLSLTEEL